MKEQKTCPHCGRPLMAGDTECGYCGARVGGGSGKKALILLIVVAVVAALGLTGWWLYRKAPQPIPVYPAQGQDNTGILDEAIAQAQELLAFYPHSQITLAQQLEEMDYPRKLAHQAAAACGADWNANAMAQITMCLEDEMDGYSEKALADYLSWAGFSPDQIQYAIDNLPEVDWLEQAQRCAARYLTVIPMSRADLISQLEFEGFTPEQALAAADTCGADWKENALTAAREESSDLSDEELREVLEYDEFTEEEIQYALENR